MSSIEIYTILEWIAALLGIGYVVLASKQHIGCWWCAGASTLLYTIVFLDVALLYSMMLNAYYFIMAVYGWLQWRGLLGAKDVHGRARPVQEKPLLWHVGVIIVGLVASVLVIVMFQPQWQTWASVDVFVTVFSVMTTVMVAHKVLSNWLYWMVINSLAMLLYWHYALYATVGLFAVYWVISIYGWREWRNSYHAQVTVK